MSARSCSVGESTVRHGETGGSTKNGTDEFAGDWIADAHGCPAWDRDQLAEALQAGLRGRADGLEEDTERQGHHRSRDASPPVDSGYRACHDPRIVVGGGR